MGKCAIGLMVLAVLAGCSSDTGLKPDSEVVLTTDLYVANLSAESILEVYVRPQGGGEWGDNRISSPIRPGNWYAFVGKVDSGLYDIRMVGESLVREALQFNCVSDAVAVSFRP